MKKFIEVIPIIVLLSLLPIQVVYASTIAPPTSLQIYPASVTAYKDLIKTGDVLILAKYNITYATTPVQTATEAYIVKLLDVTGKIVGATSPFNYYNKGYGDGVVSLYFESGVTWGGNYSLYLEGNPLLTWTGAGRPITSSSITTWEVNKALIENQIIRLADELEVSWQINLLDQTAAGPKLSAYGEAYFTNVIQNLRLIAPNVFRAIVGVPVYREKKATMEYAHQLSKIWDTTEYKEHLDTLANFFGLSTGMFTGIFWMLLTIWVMIATTIAVGSAKPVLPLSILMLMLGNLLGFLSLLVTITLAVGATLLLGYVFFYRGAT